MKTFLSLCFVLLSCTALKAQTAPVSYTCGPAYPTPELQGLMDSTATYAGMWNGWMDAGLVYHDGLNAWFSFRDTAYVAKLEPGGYTLEVIPGSGDTSLFNALEWFPDSVSEFGWPTMSQVFWFNGSTYLADYWGIRQAGTMQYWSYPDSASRQVMYATEANGSVWLITANVFDSLVSVLKFDGSAVTAYWSTTYHFSGYGLSAFVLDDMLYYNIDTALHTFNTASNTFGFFDNAAYPGNEFIPVEFGLNNEGKIVGLGEAVADSLSGTFLVQEFNGTSWEPGTPLVVQFWGDVSRARLLFTNTHLVLSYDEFIGYNEVYETVFYPGSWYSEYWYEVIQSFYTPSQWGFSAPAARNGDDLYLLASYSSMVGNAGPCGNPYAFYIKLKSPDFTGTGKIYLDANSNGVFDGTDYPIDHVPVCNPTISCGMSNANGDYTIYLDSTANVITPESIQNFTAVPASYTLNNVDSNLVNLDFAFQPVSVVSDLAAVTAYSWQPPRPGFTITYELKVANAGTVPLADTVVFTFDSKFSFGSANPAPLYQNGNSVAWLTATVNPLVAANPFTVELTLDAATPIGTEVSHTMTLAAANDDEPANDHLELVQTVVGSWDPNDKAANPPYWTQDGEDIQYTIRFQNTGTDTAFNIVVRDTLDPNLDWTSFDLLQASHPVQVDLNPTNGAVAFQFANILLADSNVNEPASHGRIVYTIKSQNGLVDGTPINNTASIYFDYNLPVVTNTTLNVIGEPQRTSNLRTNAPTLIPNPANAAVTAIHRDANASRYVLTDVLGRNVSSLAAHPAGQTTITLENLKPGTYMVTLFDGAGNAMGHTRLVVIR